MTNLTRRHFIKTAVVGLSVAGSVGAFRRKAVEDRQILVIGDSLISGQGLEEKDKIYNLLASMLDQEMFASQNVVKVKVLAHSGASLILKQREEVELKKADIDVNKQFHTEVNLNFPTISDQIKNSTDLFRDGSSPDLIILSGGITDIGINNILDPFKNNEVLKSEITKNCKLEMTKQLVELGYKFPKAKIALIGYYPFISKLTPKSVIVDGIVETYGISRPFHPFINNSLNRMILKKRINKMRERVKIWRENSDVEFMNAVKAANASLDRDSVIFIKNPLTDVNSLGAKDRMLWQLGKNGEPQDSRVIERKKECRTTIGEINSKTDLKYSVRRCEMASIGHPDKRGAQLIAGEIFDKVKAALGEKILSNQR